MKTLQLRWMGPCALAVFACLACSRATPPTPPQYEPAESLLTIIAEFQRYRDADLYRFPCPRDVSGQNVFKAALVRLKNYETLYPQKYAELLAYTRAQAYARLGDYETAARFGKEAQGLKGGLAARAGEDIRIIEEFHVATTYQRQVESLADFQKALEERIEKCKQLIARHPRQPWRSLAECEWEQAEVDLSEFLWANRQVLRDGPKRAFDQMEAVRTHHRQSKNYFRHTLRVGDWALELAGEYEILFPPERALFLWDEFERWVAKAKGYYLEVAQSFGAQERTEAAAKLAAVEALEHRCRELNQ